MKSSAVKSPIIKFLYRLLDNPSQKASMGYVIGVFWIVGLLLPIGILHELFIHRNDRKEKCVE
jgi:hypothetical protein